MRYYNGVSGSYISTGGERGSTMVYATITCSSNTSSTGNSSNAISAIFASPPSPMTAYQLIALNNSTVDWTGYVCSIETGLSAAAAADVVPMETFTIYPSSQQFYGGKTILTLDDGIFNNGSLKIILSNNTTGTSDSTSVSIKVAIKEWY